MSQMATTSSAIALKRIARRAPRSIVGPPGRIRSSNNVGSAANDRYAAAPTRIAPKIQNRGRRTAHPTPTSRPTSIVHRSSRAAIGAHCDGASEPVSRASGRRSTKRTVHRTRRIILTAMNELSRSVAIFTLAAVAGVGPASAQAPDYRDATNWLCRPGRQDACAADLTTTIVAADGTLTREIWKADPNAPIDCFYVYPTVSADATLNSDMNAGPEERRVVRSQFARFGSQCRLYAPIYRQISLAGLRAGVFGAIDGSNLLAHVSASRERALAYDDVVGAWHSYLRHDNDGRGIVLIGHSQ